MELKAKLLEKFDIVDISATFRKRDFVVEYAENPQYPEFVKFELIQEKCEFIDSFEVGQEMIIHFNLKGRKWINPKGETVYFNSLHAWKLMNINAEAPAAQSPTEPSDMPPTDPAYDDQIPF